MMSQGCQMTALRIMERVRGMNRKTEELEEIIGYHFKNKHYLTQALTHSSYANEKKLGEAGQQ